MLRTTTILLATVALTLASGCGGGDDDQPIAIETLFPADGEVGSFVEDTGAGAAGVEVAETSNEIEALIDGDAVPFDAAGFLVFGRQQYTDGGSYQLEVRVYEMPSAAVAAELYADLVVERDLYSTNTWTDLDIGEASRIANTNGTSFWLNVQKGVYYFEVRINQATIDDTVSQGHAEAFGTAIAGKIP